MRQKLIGLFVLAGFAGILLIPTLGLNPVGGQQQPAGGKKGGKKGGGGGAAFDPTQQGGGKKGGKKGNQGGGGGGFNLPGVGNFANAGGGGGGMGNMGNMMDPNTAFEFLAKGSDSIVIANSNILKTMGIDQWAAENGVTNGLINREQFLAFSQGVMSRIQSSGLFGANGFNPDQAAVAAFKRADKNSDGLLNEDEMPGNLKPVWQNYDRNKDGVIDLEEFKAFYRDSFGSQTGAMAAIGEIVTEAWDAPPVVFRAGKLPPGLPSWFVGCDRDNDGQVGLYEWIQYSGGRSIGEFQLMDRNGDGLLTAEEVMWYMSRMTNLAGGTLSDKGYMAIGPGTFDPNAMMNMNNAKKGKGKGGKGGPGGPGGGPGGYGTAGGFGGFDPNGGGAGGFGKGGKGGKGGGKGGPGGGPGGKGGGKGGKGGGGAGGFGGFGGGQGGAGAGGFGGFGGGQGGVQIDPAMIQQFIQGKRGGGGGGN